MAIEDRLERINNRGFRVHQAYQRFKLTKKGEEQDPDKWYWDVTLVAWGWKNGSPWDYFNGSGDSFEDALRDAYRKGKVKMAALEGLSGKDLYKELNPSYDPAVKIVPKTAPEKAKKRVRL